jgi:hypothetical protein
MTLDLPADHPFAKALESGCRALESMHELPHGQLLSVRVDILTGAVEIHEVLVPKLNHDRVPMLSVAEEQAVREKEWTRHERQQWVAGERPQP